MVSFESNNNRAETPLPEDESRILSEVQNNGQAVMTKEGTVRFVEKKKGIESKGYYHGLLPNADIDGFLRHNGDFCVRDIEVEAGQERQRCLCVRWLDKNRQFVLHLTPKNTVTLDRKSEMAPQFLSVEDLVEHYIQSKEPFFDINCRLFTPIMHKKWEFSHSQIELKKKLGEGAFGEVYSGFVNKDKKRHPVAIKTVKCAHTTKESIEETMAEARLMRLLSHPNIVHFYGVAAEQEPLMILMELVKGGGLDSYLEDNNVNISMESRLGMCVDVAHGLEYLHKKLFFTGVYWDVAARNCLYANERLKLSDFGMSRQGLQYQMKPQDRAPIRWMAPEVFVTKLNNTASDVWAMGVLFFEIFHNGEEPYHGWVCGQVRHEVLKKNFRLSLPHWAPDNMKQLVTRIWNPEPSKRVTSAQVARLLEKIFDSANKNLNSVDNIDPVYIQRIDNAGLLSSSADDSVRQVRSHRVRRQKIHKKSGQKKQSSKKEHKRISRTDASNENKKNSPELEISSKSKKKHKSRNRKKKSKEAAKEVLSRDVDIKASHNKKKKKRIEWTSGPKK